MFKEYKLKRMSINWNSRSATLLLLCGVLLSGCFEGTKKPLVETNPIVSYENSAPKAATIPASESVPAPTPTKVDVHVYLEISNGMKGFMPVPSVGNKATEFQIRLNKMLSDIQYGKAVSSSYFFAKEDKKGNPALDSTTFETLKNTITSGSNEEVLGTPLPALIQGALAKSAKQGAVSIIISDFIHGPKPDQKGQFISMPTDIRGSMQLAAKNDLVVAVFADASSFFGSYHPAIKTPEIKRTLKGEALIPYYIWVIGKQKDVQYLTTKMLSNLPAQQAYYGFTYAAVPFSALPKSTKFQSSGNVYCNTKAPAACTSISLDPQKDTPVEFVVGLNLKSLPKPLQQAAYLKKHLKSSALGAKASIATVSAANSSTTSNPDLAKFTHFVRLSVPSLSAAKGTITIKLPHVNPDWVSTWSTTDDNNPVASPKKTFQFDRIIEGVQDLYKGQSKDVFSVTMKFNKAE